MGGPPAKRPRQDPPDREGREEEDDAGMGEDGTDSQSLPPDPSDFLHRENEEDIVQQVYL